jgi:hypothetical protein
MNGKRALADYAAITIGGGVFFDGVGMLRGRRSRTREQLRACARLALVALPALGHRAPATRAVWVLLPERLDGRISIELSEDARIARTAPTSISSARCRIDVRAIRNSVLMRYARALYDGTHTWAPWVTSNLDDGMVTPENLKADISTEGARDAGSVGGATSLPASSSAGGGGAAAPWGILAVLAAGGGARAERTARRRGATNRGPVSPGLLRE